MAASATGFDPQDVTTWIIPDADLYGIAIRGNAAWAVGYWGSVLRSSDGGLTWVAEPTPTSEHLFAVSFADETHGWAVGAGGTVLRSEDGGENWRLQPVWRSDAFGGRERWKGPLFDVAAVSPLEAWAVGDFGVVLHTANGVDWEPLEIPAEAFADENIPDRIFNGVAFSDREHGWIVGEFATALRTSDGGHTWVGRRRLQGAGEDVYLMDLAADASGRAVATGIGGTALWTSDGGAAWSAASVPTQAGLFGAALAGERALVVGDRGVIFATRDGGQSWFDPPRPRLFNWLRAAAFGPTGLVLVVGEKGVILRSTDAGESWQQTAGQRPPTS